MEPQGFLLGRGVDVRLKSKKDLFAVVNNDERRGKAVGKGGGPPAQRHHQRWTGRTGKGCTLLNTRGTPTL